MLRSYMESQLKGYFNNNQKSIPSAIRNNMESHVLKFQNPA